MRRSWSHVTIPKDKAKPLTGTNPNYLNAFAEKYGFSYEATNLIFYTKKDEDGSLKGIIPSV